MANEFDNATKIEDAQFPGYIVYWYWQPEADKQYVGITKTGNISKRYRNGSGYRKRCPHLWNAIEKYGWESFAKDVLQYGLSKEDAEEWEKYYIFKWDLQNPVKGYNIKSGGHAGKGMSAEGRASMHEKNSGLNANKQRPVCVFDLNGYKIGEFPLISFAADHYGIKRGTIINSLRKGNHPCFGMIFKYSDEVDGADRLSANEVRKYLEKKDVSGGNNYRAKSVVVFDSITGERLGIFETVSKARESYDGDVFGCLRGRQKTFGKRYTARYLNDVGEILVLPKNERYDPRTALPNHRKKIIQYSLQGEFIAEYESAAEASRKTGIGRTAISLCATGKTKSSGGYRWEYRE